MKFNSFLVTSHICCLVYVTIIYAVPSRLIKTSNVRVDKENSTLTIHFMHLFICKISFVITIKTIFVLGENK